MTNVPQPQVGAAQFIAPFTIGHGPVQQFLGQHIMKIPDIQRPYAWRLEEAKELVRDLMKMETARLAGAAQPQHYLGSLVVVTIANGRDEIIDGQQRLTTISVLIGQLIRAFRELADKCNQTAKTNNNAAVKQAFRNIEQNALNKITILENLVKVPTGIDPNTQQPLYEPRLIVSPEITKTYGDLIDGGDGSKAATAETKEPAKQLREIAKHLYKHFVINAGYSKLQEAAQFAHLDIRANQVTSGLIWVRLATQHANSAAELFESLNARGRPLNVLALVKVWMLGTLKQVNAPAALEAQISADFRSLTDDNDEIAVKFFTDFYRIRALMDVKDKVAPKELSLLARENVFRDPVIAAPARAANLSQLAQLISDEVSLMKRLWPTWASLNFGALGVAKKMSSLSRLPAACAAVPNPAWVNSRLNLLLSKKWLQHQIVFPFLTAFADYCGNTNQQSLFEDVLHDLERLFFRAKSICNVDPKELHKIYFKQLELLKLHNSVNVALMRQEMQALIARHAPAVEFSQGLIQKCEYQKGDYLAKYLLSVIDMYQTAGLKQPGQPLVPQKGQNLLNLDDWQLEHIVPQRPQAGAHSLPANEVDRLGNLCLLPPDWNRFMTNHPYPTKRQMAAQRINSQKIHLSVKDSFEIFMNPQYANTQWASADVAARETQLVKRALDIFDF
jgi:hypothetical protein